MKIYFKNRETQTLDLHEVSFWSFTKCTMLAQLTITGIVYLTLFVIGFGLGIIGWI